MAEEPIPESVRRFAGQYIDSVAHLEGLLLLHSNPQQEWSADELAHRLYCESSLAESVLSQLHNHGLLLLRKHEGLLYRYSPGSTELEHVVVELEGAYRTHLVAVTNLIHSKVDTKLRRLSDAFRL